MKKSIIRIACVLAAMGVPAFPAVAQSIEESLTVEGKYRPDILPADRLAIAPTAVKLKAPQSPLEYDRRGVVTDFAPDALSMPATGWQSVHALDASKGYLDFRLGSWLNSSLSAGYRVMDTDVTSLDVRLQHNSTSLWQAWKHDEAEHTGPSAARRFRYDETLGADLRQKVGHAGTLQATLQYHLGYFNYYGTTIGDVKDGHIDAPTQTVNDIYAKARWAGRPIGRFSYEAGADVRHFAYRAAYVPATTPDLSLVSGKGERETVFNIGGRVGYTLSAISSLGLGLQYSGVDNYIGGDVARVRLTPAYVAERKGYRLSIGAELALVKTTGTRFRIAPDISFSGKRGLLAFKAAIGGGTHLRTLALLHDADYYANPAFGCNGVAYSPIDASLGFRLNPGGKWTFGVEGIWRTTLDETFVGWYQAYLNGLDTPHSSIGRIHGFSLAVNAGYEFCRYFGLNARGAWQPQHGNSGFLNGFDRPALTLDMSAESHPMEKLGIALAYRLRAKRMLVDGNVSRLDLTADYRVTDRLSVGAEIRNILNRHEEILPCLPMEGLTATAGLQITF